MRNKSGRTCAKAKELAGAALSVLKLKRADFSLITRAGFLFGL